MRKPRAKPGAFLLAQTPCCASRRRSESLEGDDGAGVLDARHDLHLLVHEMADVGVLVDIELDQQIELAGGRVYFRSDLGFGKSVRHVVGLAKLAFDLDEEGNHARLRAAGGAAPQSSKIGPG